MDGYTCVRTPYSEGLSLNFALGRFDKCEDGSSMQVSGVKLMAGHLSTDMDTILRTVLVQMILHSILVKPCSNEEPSSLRLGKPELRGEISCISKSCPHPDVWSIL